MGFLVQALPVELGPFPEVGAAGAAKAGNKTSYVWGFSSTATTASGALALDSMTATGVSEGGAEADASIATTGSAAKSDGCSFMFKLVSAQTVSMFLAGGRSVSAKNKQTGCEKKKNFFWGCIQFFLDFLDRDL